MNPLQRWAVLQGIPVKETTNLVVFPETAFSDRSIPKGSEAALFRAGTNAVSGLIDTLLADGGQLSLDRAVAVAREAGICVLVRAAPPAAWSLARSATEGALFVSEDGSSRHWLQPNERVREATPSALAAAVSG